MLLGFVQHSIRMLGMILSTIVLSAVAAFPQSSELIEISPDGGSLAIALESTIDIRVAENMANVYVSEPAVLDVQVLDSVSIRLIPLSEGRAEVKVEGGSGEGIGRLSVDVVPAERSSVTIHRRGQLSRYECKWGVCGFIPDAVEQAFESVAVFFPNASKIEGDGVGQEAKPRFQSFEEGADAFAQCVDAQGTCASDCQTTQCMKSCSATLTLCMEDAAKLSSAKSNDTLSAP